MSDSKNIYQRINAVMAAVRYVQKDKQVTGSGTNYRAVTHDQLLSVLRGAMVEHGIVVFPYQESSSLPIMRDVEKQVKMHLYSGDYFIHFVNIDKPDDRLTVKINAHAADNGDKAPGKAITYATKSAMLKVFSLETGEDDESRADYRESIDSEQAGEIKALLESTKSDTKKFLQVFQIVSVDEMPRASFGRALGLLRKKAAA